MSHNFSGQNEVVILADRVQALTEWSLFTSVSPLCSSLRGKRNPVLTTATSKVHYLKSSANPHGCADSIGKYCPLELQPGRQRFCPFRVGQFRVGRNLLPASMNASGRYVKPLSCSRAFPQLACSPGRCRLIIVFMP